MLTYRVCMTQAPHITVRVPAGPCDYDSTEASFVEMLLHFDGAVSAETEMGAPFSPHPAAFRFFDDALCYRCEVLNGADPVMHLWLPLFRLVAWRSRQAGTAFTEARPLPAKTASLRPPAPQNPALADCDFSAPHAALNAALREYERGDRQAPELCLADRFKYYHRPELQARPPLWVKWSPQPAGDAEFHFDCGYSA